jgi:sialate O-acetylesterase
VTVRLSLDSGSPGPDLAKAVTDKSGRWSVTLDLSNAAEGPYSLEAKGRNTVTLRDVAVGQVWVCSGQSNMDWSLSRTTNAAKAIAASANPGLRVFVPVHQTSDHPLAEIQGTWQVAGPATSGGFPAVGYWFGKDVQEALRVPVGLVHISWGGSPVEAWTSADALASNRDLAEGSANVERTMASFPAKLASYEAALRAWEDKYGRRGPPAADPSAYTGPDVSTADWRPVQLPGALADAGLPDAGAIWLRRTFVITPEMAIGPLFINLGVLRDFDTFYINGVKVGETTPHTGGSASGRGYYMEVNSFKPGPVVLALRLVAPAGDAAVIASKAGFSIDTASLAGTWLAKVEYALPQVSADALQSYPPPLATPPYASKTPTYLFNGMVGPVIPYAIRGVVWYQGEDNGPRGYQYGTAFPLMIEDWRRHWAEGDFPFYYCQLPKFGPIRPDPGESEWADLREAQTKTLSLPHTGEAVLIDLGETGDIHPRDKTVVGARLARLALARTYGIKVADSGPFYESMKVRNGAALIRFRHADGGLVTHQLPEKYRPMTVDPTMLPLVLPSPGSQVQGFAVCGADRRWVWADATIEGPDTVRVKSPAVSHPVAVRYAWASSPICNLFNGEGLPAAPFRTDDFPEVTQNVKYGLTP